MANNEAYIATTDGGIIACQDGKRTELERKEDAGPHLRDVIQVIAAFLGRRIRKLMMSLSA